MMFAALALAWAGLAPQDGFFTTVTKESGIEAAVDAKYAKDPG